jgi:hypothetical protein
LKEEEPGRGTITEKSAENLLHYHERTNQGRYRQGRTPSDTFTDGLQICNQCVFDDDVEEMAAA